MTEDDDEGRGKRKRPEDRVTAYSGCSYASEPREFFIDGVRHIVGRVYATWLEQTPGLEGLTRQIWRVSDQRGRRYRLTYYRVSDFWEVERETGLP